MPKVVIVGAGISGLALAYRLHQAAPSCDIQVLEQRARPGGTIWTAEHDGFRFEHGPNGFLDNKPTTLTLCHDLGLADRLIQASEAAGRNRYLFLDGELRALPAGLGAFLRTDLISWRGKLGFLAERFRRPRRSSADESIDAFARRRVGREAAEIFADALVTGIHAGDPKLLSIRAAFPRLARFEQEQGSILKGFAHAAKQRRTEARARGEVPQELGKMWTFREGMRVLIEQLTKVLKSPPVLGVSVRRLEKQDRGESARPRWIVHGEGQDRWNADAVVLTCPAYQQAMVVAGLDGTLAEQIGGIAYNRVAVVALGFRRAAVPIAVDGFGYIAPQRTRRDVLGVQWCSSIFPDRAPADAVLLRAMCGGWHRPELVGWDDARLLAAVRQELAQAMGIQAAPIFQQIVRWDRAIPQYHLGHLERVAWIEDRVARHPGLFVGGNAYHGVAMNDCTEQAELLALRLTRYLA